jgi:hypothetical protein
LDFVTDPSSDGGGNTVHFAQSDHILIRNCRMDGFDGTTRKPQETLKVNQVQHIDVEDSDISGAFWFALDYVAVQYGHIQGCQIHDASEDCLLLKGGTAQIRVEGSRIYNSGRFGFSAGQGTGFDYFVVPWLHYEAYDLKFINNVVYNTGYAGAAVLGGYNVLIADNTFYKVGIDPGGDRTLLTFNLGQRGCDGSEKDTCDAHHRLGGWGPGSWSAPPLPYGNEVDCIPNKNVYIYNNVIYNPGADSTVGGHFEVRAPYDASDQSPGFLWSCNLPNPVLSDDNLRIKGNLIWNGSRSKWLGLDETTGCSDANEECNLARLSADNTINSIEPELVDPAHLDFHPVSEGSVFSSTTFAIPDFTGTDRPSTPPVPLGNLGNQIPRDFDGNARQTTTPPGAFSATISTSSMNYAFSRNGWYMVSLPVIPQDSAVSVLFPGALDHAAFTWDPAAGAYSTVTKMKAKTGYWIAIPSPTSCVISGIPLTSYTLHFSAQGWYMIGSVLGGADFTNPDCAPNGAVLSPAFVWDPAIGDYVQTTLLNEKKGYWAAVFGECDLTVGGGGSTSTAAREDWESFYRKHGKTPPGPPNVDLVTGKLVKLPTTYGLSQNYPNPFNPETTIRYQIPAAGHVRMVIYNMMGQAARHLVDGNRPAGVHQAVWNGLDDHGNSLGSGVYLVRMEAGSFMSMRKVMLMK